VLPIASAVIAIQIEIINIIVNYRYMYVKYIYAKRVFMRLNTTERYAIIT